MRRYRSVGTAECATYLWEPSIAEMVETSALKRPNFETYHLENVFEFEVAAFEGTMAWK